MGFAFLIVDTLSKDDEYHYFSSFLNHIFEISPLVVKQIDFVAKVQVGSHKLCTHLTLSQISPGYVSVVLVFWKHWEKEKLLIMSNFSFSHNVFYLFGELSGIIVKFRIVVFKLFQFGRVQNLSFGKGLKCTTQNVQPHLSSTLPEKEISSPRQIFFCWR